MSKNRRSKAGRSRRPKARPARPASLKPKKSPQPKLSGIQVPAGLSPVSIDDEQRLAADLMVARTKLQNKDKLIAALYDDVAALRRQVLQSEIDASARENQVTAEKYGLPQGFEAMVRDADGNWHVLVKEDDLAKHVALASAPPQDDDDGAEGSGDESDAEAPPETPEAPKGDDAEGSQTEAPE